MIHADIEEEALELVAAAGAAGATARLLGGIAVRQQTPSVEQALHRRSGDIDIAVATRGEEEAVLELLGARGYELDARFNSMNSGSRGIAHDPGNDRHVDLFVGSFEMCHTIPLEGLAAEALTIPLAELLLTKLQIVELNEKDLMDICALLAGREVDSGDAGVIDCDRVAALCADDWGLWRTAGLNLERLDGRLDELGLAVETTVTIAARREKLGRAIEERPKSRRWRMRARIGDRKRWYREADEVDEG
ncbi:MAG: hypothetical protein JST08_03995 [Actinobacteria bacterium]|nr:hypothetical protein [Actinomycetota bacterium]